jgi:hypothetical protein
MPRGRKPLANPSELRNVVLTVRLTQAEYRYVQALAMKQGRPMGEVVRSLVLAGMPRELTGGES